MLRALCRLVELYRHRLQGQIERDSNRRIFITINCLLVQTYLPSKPGQVVGLWRNDLETGYGETLGSQQQAETNSLNPGECLFYAVYI